MCCRNPTELRALSLLVEIVLGCMLTKASLLEVSTIIFVQTSLIHKLLSPPHLILLILVVLSTEENQLLSLDLLRLLLELHQPRAHVNLLV